LGTDVVAGKSTVLKVLPNFRKPWLAPATSM
jgi:hypothetical protein